MISNNFFLMKAKILIWELCIIRACNCQLVWWCTSVSFIHVIKILHLKRVSLWFSDQFFIHRQCHAYNNRLRKQSHRYHPDIRESRKTFAIPHRNVQNWWRITWFVRECTNWLQKILHLSAEMPGRSNFPFLLCWHFRL